MFKKLENLFNANEKLVEVSKSLEEVTKDRDAQLAKVKEFEAKNKDYIESAQTADQMKTAHKQEIENLKKEYEAKLAEKNQAVETVKAEAAKEIAVTKESVAAESIAIVAAQGTNVDVKTETKSLNIKDALATLKTLKGQSAQDFYTENKPLFAAYIKSPSATV
jgi:hypothetical protein